jgi:hypothetical protein
MSAQGLRVLFRLASINSICLVTAGPAMAAGETCPEATIEALGINVSAESGDADAATSSCSIGSKDGYPAPDSSCTPGAYNPSVTLDSLKNSFLRTTCLRDKATTEKEKGQTYGWYQVHHPTSSEAHTCELDHLVPLELGGADTADNIWPQCGKDPASGEIYFHIKDTIETCAAEMVKAGERRSVRRARISRTMIG